MDVKGFDHAIGMLDRAAARLMESATNQRGKKPEKSFADFELAEEMKNAVKMLKRSTPREPELEGSGNVWWFDCPGCRGEVEQYNNFCRKCGQALQWEKVTK